jgi:hypothetical protein
VSLEILDENRFIVIGGFGRSSMPIETGILKQIFDEFI